MFDGQTDESEMGVTYAELDAHISGETVTEDKSAIIEKTALGYTAGLLGAASLAIAPTNN